jgi:hypothetical protein
MLIRVVTSFFSAIVVFMVFSSKSAVLCAYTMKTIPVIKTDRAAQKSRAEQGDTCNSVQPIAKNLHPADPADVSDL